MTKARKEVHGAIAVLLRKAAAAEADKVSVAALAAMDVEELKRLLPLSLLRLEESGTESWAMVVHRTAHPTKTSAAGLSVKLSRNGAQAGAGQAGGKKKFVGMALGMAAGAAMGAMGGMGMGMMGGMGRMMPLNLS